MALKTETKDYISKLAQQFGLDEKALLKKAEDDENAARFVDEGVMLRSDYSRKQDELARLRTEAEALKTRNESYYQSEWLPKWNQREQEIKQKEQELQRFQAEAAAYKAIYGDLAGFTPSTAAGGTPTNPAVATATQWQLSKEQYEKDIAQNRELAAIVAKEVAYATARYSKEFNDVLDVDKFEEFLGKNNYLQRGTAGIREGFDSFVKPQRDERTKVELEQKLKEAREEGIKEGRLAAAGTPFETGQPAMSHSPFFRPADDNEKVLNDPNTPAYVKEDLQRRKFLEDLGGPINLSAALAGR